MKTAAPNLQPKSSVPISSRRREKAVWLTGWFFLALVLALALVWLPYLVRSSSFQLPILDDQYNPRYTTGFYDNEQSNTGRVYRWTAAQASVQLPSTLLPHHLTLELAAPRSTNKPTPTVQVFYNQQLISTFQVTTDFKQYSLNLPEQWEWTGGTLELKVAPTTLQPTKDGQREVGVAIMGLAEIAASAPPLTLWLSTWLIVASLFWAATRLFPAKFFLIRTGIGYICFASAPVLVLVMGWNLDRLTAQAALGWYALVAIWMVLGLAFGPKLFPAPQPRLNSKSWQINGGFLAQSRVQAAKFYPHLGVWLYFLKIGLPAMVLGMAVWVQYNQVFDQSYGFYWDDYGIARPWTTQQVLGTFVGTWDPLHLEPEYYRPLTALSFALDYALWGLGAWGYHLTNLLLAMGVALCGYNFGRVCGATRLVALLAAIFLVTLPNSTATAVWVSQRSDSLALLFMLTSLLFFAQFWKRQTKIYYLLANLALLLALGCKETSVVLPALWLLWAWLYTERWVVWRQWLVFAPPSIITGLYLSLRTLVIHSPGNLTIGDLWQGYTQAVTQTFYGFDFLVGNPAKSENGLDSLLTIMLLLLLAGCLLGRSWQLYKGYPLKMVGGWQLFFVGLGWVMLACLPLSLLKSSYGINLRVLYSPAFGYALMVGGAVWGGYVFIQQRVGSKAFWPLVLASLFCLWLVYTPINRANLRSQKDYAPYAEGSNGTLHWDNWILQQPEWVKKIPPEQVVFLEQKLKKP